MSSMYPESVTPDAPGKLYAIITGSNTRPEKVWATVILTSQEEVDLVLEGNAKIYNDWKLNNSELPSSLFSPSGVLLGMNELNGIMFGEESHCVITYIICVTAKRSHTEMFTEIKKLADELPDHQLSSRSQNGNRADHG